MRSYFSGFAMQNEKKMVQPSTGRQQEQRKEWEEIKKEE
jgi:hypothetical protein